MTNATPAKTSDSTEYHLNPSTIIRGRRRPPTSLTLTKPGLIAYLKDLAKRLHKDTLSCNDVNSDGKINVNTIIRVFDSFSKALVESGFHPKRSYRRDRPKMLRHLAELMVGLGRRPSKWEIKKNLLLTPGNYITEFGSIDAACKKASVFMKRGVEHNDRGIRTFNVEPGWLMPDFARALVKGKITLAKQDGARVFKLIHGNGLSGRGSALCIGLRKSFEVLKRKEVIKEFIRGEEFSILNETVLALLEVVPGLRSDPDLGATNEGVTILWLK